MPYPQAVQVDGDPEFSGTMDSVTTPLALPPGAFQEAVNLVNRGGILQTRPGYRQKVTLPSGTLQGFTIYKSQRRLPVMVSVVDGNVYLSEFPYRDYVLASTEVKLSPNTDQVYFAEAVKSVERNEDESLRVIVPKTVLVMQDGVSSPVVLDDLTLSYQQGEFSIPQGTAMKWSGSRLWVAQGDKLFVSDIADPLSFREQTYNTLGGINYFLLPGKITALSETPSLDTPQLLVFTRRSTSMFLSSIANRDSWPQTAQFQRVLFPNIGCVAHRSVVEQHGLLWWYSEFGLTNFDAAVQANSTSKLRYVDNEMALSKAHLSGDLSGIAGGVHENYLLMSVPYGDKFNRHTWVMDNAVADRQSGYLAPAWNGYWTGTRPVQWASAPVLGETRIFHASVDYGGQNVIWEAFIGRRDNDCDISWAFVTRAYSGGSVMTRKEFRWAEVFLGELAGDVDVQIRWAGIYRGKFKPAGTKRIVATEGTIDADTEMDADKFEFALKKQTRVIRSVDVREDYAEEIPLTTCGVERANTDRDTTERVDSAFQVAVIGSGPCAVQGIRVKLDHVNEQVQAHCEEDESGVHAVRFDGAASLDVADLQVADTSFEGVASSSLGEITKEGEATSTISQQSADKVALQIARARVSWQYELETPPFVGGQLFEE